MNYASLFTGGGLADWGARQAGLTPLWGVEYDPQIAAVAQQNDPTGTIYAASVCDVDYRALPRVDVLHASPPCPNFSVAKTGAAETDNDRALADAVCRAITAQQPSLFTLENVRGYIHSESFARIQACLLDLDYFVTVAVINAADYGGWNLCPVHANYAEPSWARGIAPDIVECAAMMQSDDQARILAWDVVALLVRATQAGIVADALWRVLGSEASEGQIIQAGRAVYMLMNADISANELTENMYGNIALLLSKCLGDASIQMRWFTTSTAIQQITILKIFKCLTATVNICHTTTHSADLKNDCPLCKYVQVPQTRERLFLLAHVGGWMQHQRPLPPKQPWKGWYQAIEDLIPTLPESQFAPWQLARLPEELRESVLCAASNASNEICHRRVDSPRWTIDTGYTSARAFIVPGGDASSAFARQADEPTFTVGDVNRVGNVARAWLGEFANAAREATVRYADEPSPTLSTKFRPSHRCAWLSHGRVVSMTPRALGRFQTLPDSYVLPDKKSLACRIIGNGVAVEAYAALLRSQIW
jgi:site-specific DNA-cytosine methylase